MQTNMLLFRLMVIGIILVILTVIDLYSWRGLKTVLKKLSPQKIRIIKYFFFGLSGAALLTVVLFMFFPQLQDYRSVRAFLAVFLVSTISAKASFMLFVVIEDLLHTVQWVIHKIIGKKEKMQPAPVPATTETGEEKPKGKTMSRSQFIYQSGLVVATAPIYFFSRGVIKDAHNYKIHRIKLHAPNLPDRFNGLKIVQLSDIHSGSFFDKDAVSRGVKMVMAEKPDVFFFTGDMVNVFAYEMDDYLDVFAPINAPMGSYSTLGNHDYGDYSNGWKNEEEKAQNLQNLFEHHKRLNWQLLRNEHIVLDRMGHKLGIIGVENWGSKARFPKYGDMEKAQKGMPDTPYKILLSHDPSHWDAVVRPQYKDIDLMLAGHTHGMQFGIENSFIKFSPVQWMYKQWAGLYTQGNQHLYVNRGYGYIGYPGRVGILPEITVIELMKA